MAQNPCQSLFLYSYMLMMLFSYTLDDMQHCLKTFCQIKVRIVNVDNKNDSNKDNRTKTLAHFYIQGRTNTSGCKASNILVLMSLQQISGMKAMSLDFKRVGIAIICLRKCNQ